MTIQGLVDRFLAWPLPKTVASDQCATNPDYEHARYGTSLLNADEARQMIEYLFPTLTEQMKEIERRSAPEAPERIWLTLERDHDGDFIGNWFDHKPIEEPSAEYVRAPVNDELHNLRLMIRKLAHFGDKACPICETPAPKENEGGHTRSCPVAFVLRAPVKDEPIYPSDRFCDGTTVHDKLPVRAPVNAEARLVKDLSSLVRRLVYMYEKNLAPNKLTGMARDFLRRHNLEGSPLRASEYET